MAETGETKEISGIKQFTSNAQTLKIYEEQSCNVPLPTVRRTETEECGNIAKNSNYVLLQPSKLISRQTGLWLAGMTLVLLLLGCALIMSTVCRCNKEGDKWQPVDEQDDLSQRECRQFLIDGVNGEIEVKWATRDLKLSPICEKSGGCPHLAKNCANFNGRAYRWYDDLSSCEEAWAYCKQRNSRPASLPDGGHIKALAAAIAGSKEQTLNFWIKPARYQDYYDAKMARPQMRTGSHRQEAATQKVLIHPDVDARENETYVPTGFLITVVAAIFPVASLIVGTCIWLNNFHKKHKQNVKSTKPFKEQELV